MGFLNIRTNVAVGPQYVEGALIPGSGGNETFDELVWIHRMQASQALIDLLTDDSQGAGSSTLILVDSAGADVLQGYADTFLSNAHKDPVGRADRKSDDRDILYHARTRTPGALDSDPVWQLYRRTMSTGVIEFADGDANYDNRYDQRETASYS